MDVSDTNILLALLLALKEIEVELSPDEQSALADVGYQLKIDPNDWKFIQEGLMIIIEGNAALNRLYKIAKAQLVAVDDDTLLDLLPTGAELEQADKTRNVITKGGIPGKPDPESHELINVTHIIDTTIVVLTNEDPSETSNNLLQRLSNFLKQSNKRGNQNP
jgi:hypothetical protein